MSLHWLGAFKLEMIRSYDTQTDRRTQPFIVKDYFLFSLYVDLQKLLNKENNEEDKFSFVIFEPLTSLQAQ